MNATDRPSANPYGYFDEEAREYVITRPDTPTPWINYLGEGRFGGIVSNTGGGYSFDRDPRHRRVSRYRYNAVPADQPGRYVYLRDQESGRVLERDLAARQAGAGRVRVPARRRLHAHRAPSAARHRLRAPLLRPAGRGRASPGRASSGSLRVRNRGDRPRRLRTFSYVELCFPDAVVDQQNLDWAQHIVRSRFDGRRRPRGHGLPARHDLLRVERRAARLRLRPRDVRRPLPRPRGADRRRAGRADEHRARRAETASARSATSSSSRPARSGEIVFVLGIGRRARTTLERRVSRLPRPGARSTAAFAALRERTGTAISRSFVVETPDPELDAMVNVWNQVQCRTTLHWSRFVSAYETGLGRGMGTRDSAQDTLGTVHAAPERARDDADAALAPPVPRRPHVAPVLPADRRGLARASRPSCPSGRSGSATTTSGS